MVAAKNIHGRGMNSTAFTALAANKPDKMSVPVLSMIGANVKISFTPPNSNGASISSYKVWGYNNLTLVYEDITS